MSVGEFIGLGLTLVGLLVSGAWALLALSAKQFDKRLDERFATQEKARVEAGAHWDKRFAELLDLVRFDQTRVRQVETDLLKLKAELPRDYFRRDDHIRFETVITARFDALYAELRLINSNLATRAQKG